MVRLATDAIQRAIASGRTLAISYRGAARIVLPIRIEGNYLLANCLHATGERTYRTFRLDRIEAARVWHDPKDIGPNLGRPVRTDMSELAAHIIDAEDLLCRIDALDEKQVAEFYEHIKSVRYRFNEYYRLWTEGIIEWIEAHGEPLVETAGGPRRLYVAPDKTTKCLDNRDALVAVLTATGGDVDALLGCLSSNAFKPGACKAVLGDEWPKHFEVKETKRLGEGTARKSLRLASNPEEAEDE